MKDVAGICHGVLGLLNVKNSGKTYLIKGNKLTGFNWLEETLANRRKQVPFNLKAALKEKGAEYKKAFFPVTSHVIKDGSLNNSSKSFKLQRGGQGDNGCSKKTKSDKKAIQTILGANGPIGEVIERDLNRNYTSTIGLASRRPTKIDVSDTIFSANLYTAPKRM